MRKIKWFIDAMKLIIAFFLAKFSKLKKSNRDIWLIGERRNEAGDNGFHLFRYIRENHPNRKVFYVIDSGAKDLHKVEEYNNIIFYDSFKHYFYYVLANKLVCAHLGSNVPDSPVCWKAEELGLIQKNRAFIQHGITKETLPQLMYKNTKANLFVCGAKPEYDFVREAFGYPDNGVKYLGFCRFDKIHNFSIKRQILLMPTWRQWFGLTPSTGRIEKELEEFKVSNYYKIYQSLLINKNLNKLLVENNIELIFYPHHEIQGFLDAFTTHSENIIIANEKKYDVQNSLKNSALLITDYSSVAFDFAYMRKPIIYYQFDEKLYFEKHYKKGYFDYERDGLGPVVNDEDNLIREIEKFIINDLKNEEQYLNRVNKFFPLFDNENCERNYNAICGM